MPSCDWNSPRRARSSQRYLKCLCVLGVLCGLKELFVLHAWHFDVDVYAVEQRAGACPERSEGTPCGSG